MNTKQENLLTKAIEERK